MLLGMTVVFEALLAVVLATTSVLAGVQTYVRLNVIHAIANVPAELGVRIHQELLTWRNGRINKPAGTIAGVALIGVFIVIPFASDVKETATYVLAAGAFVAVTIYFVLAQRERPANREINSWGTGPVPERYAHLRVEWDAQQYWRLALTWLGFAFTVAAV